MFLITTGIDHVNLQVSNLEKSVEFWKELLGFDVLETISEQKGAIIGTQAAMLALYEKENLGRIEKHGFSHVSFHISNFDDAVQLCEKKGITILYEGVVQWPYSQSLYIKDPDGYEIELSQKWGGAIV
ncbi:VOC family protein [SAR92 clade bacterium H921]|nr:VOC family protein [SAR92 clade bacterium H921]